MRFSAAHRIASLWERISLSCSSCTPICDAEASHTMPKHWNSVRLSRRRWAVYVSNDITRVRALQPKTHPPQHRHALVLSIGPFFLGGGKKTLPLPNGSFEHLFSMHFPENGGECLRVSHPPSFIITFYMYIWKLRQNARRASDISYFWIANQLRLGDVDAAWKGVTNGQ